MTTFIPPPGPDRHRTMVSEVALLWAAHHPGPFPDVPFDHRHDLAHLDFNMAVCVMTYLRNEGVPGPGDVEILQDCLPALRTAVALLARSAEYREGLKVFRGLLAMAELILADEA
ncbi:MULTISPECIES: hypothetical protein [unclassified Streptomyces]|uniref:hypothetical protein n=1 Tax=Streptomyces TaxID=1883 RepID=UPI00137020DA|nr:MULTISPECIES: hypothetical protein [unclassified Streptomyces]NEA05084.1 hypothetical protein [Streptomyces sp. SID10116]MYY80890.1 hypothetical protein [Streptomyces sp. SID335]MYY87113.1 hypothetical protein [Streptomyces sp. SID335]MYZ12411.1 hypothetical protein [Streptomyces sp. SID337]NDZ89466.1 hypothetical protein [Streptomyces sp. SID10115]